MNKKEYIFLAIQSTNIEAINLNDTFDFVPYVDDETDLNAWLTIRENLVIINKKRKNEIKELRS